MNKKVGILTFHYAHNYGAVLQAYALKTKLARMGYDAKVVNYQNKYIARLYRQGTHIDYWKRDILPNRWGRLIGIARKQRHGRSEWQRQWKAFEQFIGQYLMDEQLPHAGEKVLHTTDEVAQSNCDAYILGSDQIWARELTHGLDPVYFGQFASDKPKISYAASVPNGNIPEGEKTQFQEYLAQLQSVSVREETLAEELEELLQRKVDTVVDPTLLLEKCDYESLLYEHTLEEQEYLFVYYVVENPVLTKLARIAAKQLGCKLVELHYQRTPERDAEFERTQTDLDVTYIYDAGPREFLTYIRDARMVMTNSFHGTVFSILFHKQFYSVYEQNGRIQNLLDFLGISERHIYAEESLQLTEEMAYEPVAQKLAQYRSKSEQYLENALAQK